MMYTIIMTKKIIAVDSKIIDLAVDELSKLMVHLDKNPDELESVIYE